jgi:thiol-disulfide isomerase/thioredoxin
MRILRLLLSVTVALALAAGCSADKPEKAPVLQGELLGGGAYDPATHAGKVVVVNFWGSWCAPCRAEAADLNAAYEATKDSGVAFLGINIRDPNKDQAVAFVENFKVPYPSIYDPKSKLALEFDVPPTGIPNTLVLGKDGRVVHTFRSVVGKDELLTQIRAAQGNG